MRKGDLNKDELRRVGRAYSDLAAIYAKLPPHSQRDRVEESTGDLLLRAMNRCAELLRWQDFGGVWQKVKGDRP